jgi:hypothetical protein
VQEEKINAPKPAKRDICAINKTQSASDSFFGDGTNRESQSKRQRRGSAIPLSSIDSATERKLSTSTLALLLPSSTHTTQKPERKEIANNNAPTTNSCAGKNSVILHPAAGYAALGMPQSVRSMVPVGVACVMDAGMEGRGQNHMNTPAGRRSVSSKDLVKVNGSRPVEWEDIRVEI